MKTNILKYMVLASLILTACSSLMAQGHNDGQQVRRELERTDDYIVRAQEAVRASNNPLAAKTLSQAQTKQKNAWSQFGQQRLVMALKFTRDARSLAANAYSQSRNTEQIEGVVLRKLERARDVVDRAREAVSGQQQAGHRAIMRTAEDNLTRAWEFFRDHRYTAALRLADQVEKAAQRVGQQAETQGREDTLYRRRWEAVDRRVQQAREAVSDCELGSAREHLEHAVEAMGLAEDLNRDGRPAASLQALKRARNSATRAISECQGLDPLWSRHQKLTDQADRLAEKLESLGGPGGEAAQTLINKAARQLDLAGNRLKEEKLEQAITALQAAQLALRQAERYITSGS